MLEMPDLLGMAAQAAAGGCGGAWLSPYHQDGAEAFLQQLDPLGYRGRRHVELLGRLVEAAGADHRRDGAEERIVEHGLEALNSPKNL